MNSKSWCGGTGPTPKKTPTRQSGILKLSDRYIIGSSQRKHKTFFLPVSFLSQKKNTIISNFCHDLWLQNYARATYYFPHYVSQYSIMHKFSFSFYLQANAIIPFFFLKRPDLSSGVFTNNFKFFYIVTKKELRIL